MHIMKNVWSDKETQLLKDNFYATPKYRVVQLIPDKSWGAIKAKSFRLGLNRFKPYWKPNENKIIKEYYPNGKKEHILKLLPNRTWTTIKAKANFLKIKREIRSDGFTKEDTMFIVNNYLTLHYEDIARRIHRNKKSIKSNGK